MEEFTFSVSDVLDYLGVQHARSGSRDTEDVVCPICKGKKLLFIPKILHDAINGELVVVCCN